MFTRHFKCVWTVCVCAYSLSCVRLFATPMDFCPPGSSVHEDSPGKNIGVGCHASSRGSPQPRNQTRVSCIAGRFFTNWATREAGFPIYRCIYIYIYVYIYTAFFFQGKGKYNDMFGKIWRLWDKHLCFFPLKLKCSLSSISAEKDVGDYQILTLCFSDE